MSYNIINEGKVRKWGNILPWYRYQFTHIFKTYRPTNIKCLYPTYGYKIQMWRYVTFICLYLISADVNLYEVISSFIFLSAYNFYFKFLSAFALFHHLLFSFCIFITFLFAHVLHKVTLFAFFIDFDDIFSI